MRKLLISFIATFAAFSIDAQNVQVKDTRQIYLWDVTLSMKGKAAGYPDIWDKVRVSMIDDIMQIFAVV